MQRTNKLKAFYNRMSIKNKIALIYSLVFILIIFFVSCFIIINSIHYYKSSSVKEINEILDKAETYITEGNEVTPENISALNTSPYIVVRVWESKNGKVKPSDKPDGFLPDGERTEPSSGTKPEPRDRTRTKPEPPGNMVGMFDPDFRMDKIDGDSYIYTTRKVQANGKEYVVCAYRIYNHEIKMINTMSTLFIVENLVAVIIAFVIGRALSSKMLRPVHQVADAAMKISEDNFNQRIEEPEADDEIKELVRAFNDMLERLQISFERQNQFISDVSHELKTPISVIKGYTGLLSRWGKDDEEVLNEAIESISSETEHMSMLISRLLFWARNDINSSINISELCIEELLDEIKKEAEVMELPAEIQISGAESTRIDGDYHLIKQLIWIFVENAVKYSGDKNCVIRFETSLKDGHALLKIKDNGIGIKQEDIKNIFERFYRSDKSRNKEISGFGLGLSIAKWIMDHHKGKISVDSKLGEGTEFTLSFPCKY